MASGEIETVSKDIGAGPKEVVTRWLRELDLAHAHEKDWRERAHKIVEKYRNDKAKAETENKKADTSFNILYANTEVLKGVMYQKTPSPDVRRRFMDQEPLAKDAAQLLQRALSFTLDAYDFDEMCMTLVTDVLLPGRGVATVDYVPTMGPMTGPDGQPVKGADGKPVQQVVYEEVRCEAEEWDMVRMSPAKRWRKVRWMAFGKLMTREDLTKQFGNLGARCELDWAPKDKQDTTNELFKRAIVWKIWNKRDRKVYFIAKGMPDAPLRVVEDPLNLEGFFPTPRPLYGITTTDSMIPIPEYLQYQNQAEELNAITERIDMMVDALRRRGFYDSSFEELSALATAGDNEFIPIENFTNLIEKGGIEKLVYEQPLEVIAKVLMQLYDQRDRIKQVIYEVTGIADIVRGATKASETLGAQELKARYANVRIGPRQKELQRYIRDLLRLKAEIISEKFSPTTLAQITGKPVDEQVLQILRNDRLRGFRVDIETDSTIQPDAMEEQKNRTEALGAIVQYLQAIGPMVAAGGLPIDIAKELLLFGLRGFKLGPQLEDILESMGQQKPGALQPEPKPDPKAQAEQARAQIEQAKLQQEPQLKQLEGQQALQLQQARDQAAQFVKQAELAAQRELEEMRQAREDSRLQAKMAWEAEQKELDRMHDAEKHRLALEVQTEIAREDREFKGELESRRIESDHLKQSEDIAAREREGERRSAAAEAARLASKAQEKADAE